MLLGPIETWKRYKHRESGRLCEVRDIDLQAKLTGTNWTNCVRYVMVDKPGAEFSVSTDHFRKSFDARTEEDPEEKNL